MTKPISRPAIIVNFKAYLEVDGCGALDLAKACQSVFEETGIKIAICPPMVDLGLVARNVNIPVLSQNVDPHAPGSSTGWVTPSMVKGCGAIGTLINHSEHKVSIKTIEECIELSKGCELVTIICADSVKTAIQVAHCCPDFVAVEPPELIGGDISVTTANPQIIENTVESVKAINHSISVLCGAGVKTGDDVKTALDLGADGVLLASGVVKAKDPYTVLMDLVKHL
ncbi:MAG: triose-phosphate isomerase [Candidatus Methanomethylophilaceae archaeon]|nr:triose-phosphate isomerase [Candidatus Methanomethylophilaceae archaeon]MDY0223843.1 triose-phosphate isomerase [Candidatus Methanomethylophilaceae archaeon]